MGLTIIPWLCCNLLLVSLCHMRLACAVKYSLYSTPVQTSGIGRLTLQHVLVWREKDGASGAGTYVVLHVRGWSWILHLLHPRLYSATQQQWGGTL